MFKICIYSNESKMFVIFYKNPFLIHTKKFVICTCILYEFEIYIIHIKKYLKLVS